MGLLELALGVVLSGATSAVPACLYALTLWWCDRYKREPAVLVVAAFLWGRWSRSRGGQVLEILFPHRVGGSPAQCPLPLPTQHPDRPQSRVAPEPPTARPPAVDTLSISAIIPLSQALSFGWRQQ